MQVDAANFNAGGSLEGLKSSTGSAVDPDNGVDNDDNGTALAGHGVVSQALSLIAANNSVDFGFFGFDLVLDKSIEQTSATPLEELEYTVRIINDGQPRGPASDQLRRLHDPVQLRAPPLFSRASQQSASSPMGGCLRRSTPIRG